MSLNAKPGILRRRRTGRHVDRTVSRLRWAFAAVLALPAGAVVAAPDLTAVSLEQLLDMRVTTASKFSQKRSEAPSAVTVITAAEIKAHGHRTLADVLRGIRGLHVTSDRNYTYLGARGFGRPGDYNGRILLLVDGVRLNENVYDSGFIGHEFILDVDLIERVEYVPGPGSALYGNNAFFGVINVFTKRGRDYDGGEIAAGAGEAGERAGRVTYGRGGDGGRDWLLSASGYRRDGESHYYPEFDAPATNNGVAENLDQERHRSVFAKVTGSGLTVEFAHVERDKGVPTASYGQVFNDPRSETVDAQSFMALQYDRSASATLDVTARLSYGRYDYEGVYINDVPPVAVNRDETEGRWWGAEVRAVSRAWSGHTLVAGAEYQNNLRQDQRNFDVAPFVSYVDDRRRTRRWGMFVQDEFALTERWILNLGVRHEEASETRATTHPRLALVHKMSSETTIKALYGTAFRAPNTYERYYGSASTQYKINPDLQPEKIRTTELVVEHALSAQTRVTTAAYRYHIDDLITLTTDPSDGMNVYRNVETVCGKGVELEAEHAATTGVRWRTSYAWQDTEDESTGQRLSNSPRHVAKLNVSAPLGAGGWRGGLETQYTGPRRTLAANEVGGYTVVNLTLHHARPARNLEVSASVYNLFDKSYADPGSAEHTQDAIAQDGRGGRIKLSYRF